MRVKTHNLKRTHTEMLEIWSWMTNNFGPPQAHNSNLTRWTYDNETLTYGTYSIEWFEFRDSKDAEWFMLRWS